MQMVCSQHVMREFGIGFVSLHFIAFIFAPL
jgi:hypothetical protein